MSELIHSSFKIREPIMKDELMSIFNIKNKNSINQFISTLIKIGLIKVFQNGIYYVPETDERFKNLKPSLIDVINKKYCLDYSGFRTGAALLNQYKFTSQISSDYEILTSSVSKNSRNIKVFKGKATVTASKVSINKENYYYLVYSEILRNIRYSDYDEADNIILLKELFDELNLNVIKFIEILNYYKSNRFQYMHILFSKVVNYEIT